MPTRNAVGWFEIYVQDMPRARAFYEAVLGTRLEMLPTPAMEGIEMWTFPMEMEAAGCPGALVKMEGIPSGPGGTLIYFSCEDCAEQEARVLANGGQVQQPKMSIGQYGFIAVVKDPDGNLIGLHSTV